MAQVAEVRWDPEMYKGTNIGQIVIMFKLCFQEQGSPFLTDMHAYDVCWETRCRSGDKT